MRALFTTQPATGAFRPLVPLARALADAGHEVAFAAPVRSARMWKPADLRCSRPVSIGQATI